MAGAAGLLTYDRDFGPISFGQLLFVSRSGEAKGGLRLEVREVATQPVEPGSIPIAIYIYIGC